MWGKRERIGSGMFLQEKLGGKTFGSVGSGQGSRDAETRVNEVEFEKSVRH